MSVVKLKQSFEQPPHGRFIQSKFTRHVADKPSINEAASELMPQAQSQSRHGGGIEHTESITYKVRVFQEVTFFPALEKYEQVESRPANRPPSRAYETDRLRLIHAVAGSSRSAARFHSAASS